MILRLFSLIFLASSLLFACITTTPEPGGTSQSDLTASADTNQNAPINKFDQIQLGIELADVYGFLGQPNSAVQIGNASLGNIVWYYIDPATPGMTEKEDCVPISFEYGLVAAINKDLSSVWEPPNKKLSDNQPATSITSKPANRYTTKIDRVQIGMDKPDVYEIMNEPEHANYFGDSKDRCFVYYYISPDTPEMIDKKDCVPISFEYGIVAAVNKDLSAEWENALKEKTDPLEADLLALPDSDIGGRLKISEQLFELAPDNSKYRDKIYHYRELLTHKKEISKLEAKVRPIPASNIRENLRLYKRLVELAPENLKYQKKVAHYQAKLNKENGVKLNP